MRLTVRADDLDLLRWMKSLTGLGAIYGVKASGNPQVGWVVGRKRETAALVELLSRFPLRSRKRQELDLWKQAVELWQHPASVRDIVAMESLRQRLIAQRIYAPPGPSEISVAVTEPDGLIDWLGGFLTGEAHFGIHRGAVRLAVNLRADDFPLLHGLSDAMGIGKVGGPYVNRGSNPAARWTVSRTSDLVELTDLLDQRVRGRKCVEFETWRRAVTVRADKNTPAAERRRLIDAAEGELRQLRRFRPSRPLPPTASRRLQRMDEQNAVWIALLREWAADELGPLTAAGYQRARRADWPSRNTLAGRFGSWYDALGAAGLADRAALRPEVRDARLRGKAKGQEARWSAQRVRVIAALERCTRALGRWPGPTDYARWRVHNDPGAPSFGTAYRHFPGGWAELQAACAPSA